MSLQSTHLSDVRRLLRHSEDLELCAEEIQKLKWFVYALEHEGNVSLTCRHFGISRSTFLRWAERFDPRSPLTLREQSKCPHTVRAPETDARIIALIRTLRQQQPLLGKGHISELLRTTHGIEISSSTVGRVIARHKLFFADTAAHRNKRLKNTDTDDTPSSSQTLAEPPAYATDHEGLSSDASFFPESGLAPQS